MVYAGQVTHYNSCELYHYGIPNMHWGERRYQYEDGSLTPAGRLRYAQDAQNRAQRSYNKASAKLREAKQYRRRSKATTMDLEGSKLRLEVARDEKKAAKRELKRAEHLTDEAFSIKSGSLMDAARLDKQSINMSARRAKFGVGAAALGAGIGWHKITKKVLSNPKLTEATINATKKFRKSGFIAIAGLALAGRAYVDYKKRNAKQDLKAYRKSVKRGMKFESNMD